MGQRAYLSSKTGCASPHNAGMQAEVGGQTEQDVAGSHLGRELKTQEYEGPKIG